jgi:hypothetical protein
MVEFFIKKFGDQPGIKEVVDDAVRGWFEQALVETVIGIQALQGSKEWTPQNVENALSEEGLTSAVMQRYHINFVVSRELGLKLGSHRSYKAG